MSLLRSASPFLAELLACVPYVEPAVVGGPCVCCRSPVISEYTSDLFCSIDCISDYAQSDEEEDDDCMDPAWEAWLEYKLDEDYDW
jgi:hypothetical protein